MQRSVSRQSSLLRPPLTGAARDLHQSRHMEALVHDLSHALDQSSVPPQQLQQGSVPPQQNCLPPQQQVPACRRIRSCRRRSRSFSNITSEVVSDGSSSSVGDTQWSADRQLSSVQLSDSDDMVSSAGILCQSRRSSRILSLTAAADDDDVSCSARLAGRRVALAESDSLNENCLTPARFQKRNKRKMKRLSMQLGDVTPCMSAGSAMHMPLAATVRRKRSRLLSAQRGVKQTELISGKRKYCQSVASCCSMMPPSTPPSAADVTMADSTHLSLGKRSCDLMSSSSVSSEADSDGPGVTTTDDARDGDDEQSDWHHESQDELADRTAQLLRVRTDREVMAGKRRLHNARSAFSVVPALNVHVSQFAQDCGRYQLQLPASDSSTQQQLRHLANVYQLKYSVSANHTVSLTKHKSRLGSCSSGNRSSVRRAPYPLSPCSSWTHSSHTAHKKCRRSTPCQSSSVASASLSDTGQQFRAPKVPPPLRSPTQTKKA